MRFILWTIVYIFILFCEIFVLPKFFGASVLPFSFSIAIIAIADQVFLPGILFASLAGVLRDLVTPEAAPSHTIFFLAIFLFMHFFRVITNWDEPMGRIGSIFSGLLLQVGAWTVSIALSSIFLIHASISDAFRSATAYVSPFDILFEFLWFVLYAWLMIGRYRRLRTAALATLG